MGLINPTLPTIGQPNSTEDVDLLNCLAAILAEFNGNISGANLATAVIAEANMASGANGGLAKGAFSAYRAAALTLSTASANTILWDTEEFDVSSCYDPATGRYTAPISGYYRFNVRLATGFTFTSPSGLAVNGTLAKRLDTAVPSSGNATYAGSVILRLNAGDFVTLVVQGTGGTTATVGQDSAFFQGSLIAKL